MTRNNFIKALYTVPHSFIVRTDNEINEINDIFGISSFIEYATGFEMVPSANSKIPKKEGRKIESGERKGFFYAPVEKTAEDHSKLHFITKKVEDTQPTIVYLKSIFYYIHRLQ